MSTLQQSYKSLVVISVLFHEVDLLVFALENQSPTVLVLITGDKDFTYAISILRMKGHEVYIIFPPGTRTHQGLKHIATGILDWDVVLGRGGLLQFGTMPDEQPFHRATSRNEQDTSKTFIDEFSQLSVTRKEALGDTMALAKDKRALDILSTSASTSLTDKTEKAPVLKAQPHASREEKPQSRSEPRSRAPPEVIVIDSDDDDDDVLLFGRHNVAPTKKGTTSATGPIADDDGHGNEETHLLAFKPYDREPMAKKHNDRGFSELVAALQQREDHGDTGTSLDDLERLLRKMNPSLCEQAGVPGIRQYVEQAHNAGVVLFSDIYWDNKRGWVRLNSQPQQPCQAKAKPAPRRVPERHPSGENGQKRVLKSFGGYPFPPLRLASRRGAKPGEAHYTRLVEMMQDLRIRGMHRIKDKRLFRMLREEGLMDQRTYIDKAISLGILYDRNRDGYLELHPDCC